MYIGLDIGSVSVNAVVIDDQRSVVEDHYCRTHGQPVETVAAVLKDILTRFPSPTIKGIAVTGSGGKLIGDILGCDMVNEIIAQSTATGALYPEVRTVIEIGGEDSKLIKTITQAGVSTVKDFAMNTICAAGTGSFLDQQASRLGISIEEEFGQLALKSEKPPRIAGRCSVFAKTDMIHLQQEATPDYDIVAGLCYALARNYCSNIAKGTEFEMPIAFQGGVAANLGIRRAFEDILDLGEGGLLIPEHFTSMGAIGAVLARLDKGEISSFPDIACIDEYLRTRKTKAARHDQLADGFNDFEPITEPDPIVKTLSSENKVDAYLGVDVGSISTNVVVIDREGRVLSRRYLMTAGRPLKAVTQGLSEVGEEIADKVNICGAVTTGSGRYLTGDFLGADIVKNEITTHATAAAFVDKNVDTIFEIGGQDSKYVSLENGAVVDFTMNKVCAAGTGSFLEEQAEKLNINIKEEFGKLALGAESPVHLGERCTVFMESDLNHHQQQGVPKDELIAGLSYSIVFNYLNRVVEDRKVGDYIFFQGGVAANKGVKAAFEKITGKKITVPPHHDVMGALGAALIARDADEGKGSKFKGFDLSGRKYETSAFECKACSNMCEVRRISFAGEPPLHYGSRCGKFDEDKKAGKGAHLPKLFDERKDALHNSYSKDVSDNGATKKIGIPQVASFFDLFPFWKAFFSELGFQIVLSDDTNRKLIHTGLEHITAETCFPIKVAHGHVLDVLEKGVDYLFLPSIVDMPHSFPNMIRSYNCPYVQTVPYLIKAAIDLDSVGGGAKLLEPVFHFERGPADVRKCLRKLAKELGISGGKVKHAIEAAETAQDVFYRRMEERGKEILNSLGLDERALVIVSRPYNGCDSGLNLNIPDKLRDLGVLAIPMDFLPLTEEDISDQFPYMYWKYGQKILSAARVVGGDDRLHAVYITNFGCGPDSFISKYFARELGGKPYLTIEVDEHSADVGAITRCEAYLDSLENVREGTNGRKIGPPEKGFASCGDKRRKLYVPYMDDHGFLMTAAMRANGVDAYSMPMADNRTLELGRKHCTGKECYPCLITTGDIIKHVTAPEFDRSRGAFFMPTANGPCRFGQYNKFHRMVLDDIGYEDVPIIVLDQQQGFQEDMSNLGPNFRKLAWKSFVILDAIQKMVRQTRPYEINAGETDKIYQKCLDELVDAVENGKDLVNVSHNVRQAIEAIPVDRSVQKPRIGIVGEIFVRCNQFVNNFVARKIEEIGGETLLPPMEEWINYIGYARKNDYLVDRNVKGYLRELLVQWVQRRDHQKVTAPFKGAIRCFAHEAPTAEVLKLAIPYLPSTIRGEATLSMGRAREYVEEGCQGLVNLFPFNCMPGTIVGALMSKFRKDHDDIPVLNMAYDGLEQTSERTRLEAFIYQAEQRVLDKQNSKS